MNQLNDENKFNGFPKDFINFLFFLHINNTVDMLEKNKSEFKRLITAPQIRLFNALIPSVLAVSETVVIKPAKCVSSMYSDMRFSRNRPLKEYIYIRFREPFSKTDILGLYFDMGSENYSYGIRIYNQTSAGMDRIREYLVKNIRISAETLKRTEKTNAAFIGEKYAKDRYAGIKDRTLNDFLNRRSLYIGVNRGINESVFSAELCREISDTFIGLAEIYQLIKNALY